MGLISATSPPHIKYLSVDKNRETRFPGDGEGEFSIIGDKPMGKKVDREGLYVLSYPYN